MPNGDNWSDEELAEFRKRMIAHTAAVYDVICELNVVIANVTAKLKVLRAKFEEEPTP